MSVIAGVVVAFATEPANPFALTTEAEVTVPVPETVAHLIPSVFVESAMRTVPSDPTPRRVAVVE